MYIYIIIIIVAFLFSLNSCKKIEEIIPITFSTMALAMYLFSRIFSLECSVRMELLFAAIAIGILFLITVMKHERPMGKIKNYCLTPGLLGFLIVVFFFLLFDRGRGLVHSDDLTFWGYGVRYMYEYGVMYEPNAGYPPVPFLWEYLANKTWIGYSEGISMAALAIWSATMLMPLYRKIQKVSSIKWWIVTSFILLIPISLSIEAYDTLVPDFLLSTTIAYTAMYMYQFCEHPSRFSLICILIGLFSCSLSKRTGIIFSALLIMGFIVMLKACQLLDKKRWSQIAIGSLFVSGVYSLWPGGGKYTILPVAMTVAWFAILQSWNWIRKAGNLYGEKRIIKKEIFTILMLITGIVFLLISYKYSNHIEDGRVVCNYLKNIFSTNYSYIGSVIHIPLFAFLMGTAIIIVVGKEVCVRKEKYESYEKLHNSIFAMIFLSAAYLVILGYLYVTTIAPANEGFGVYIPSFERYVLPCYYSILVIALDYIIKYENGRVMTYGTAFALLFICSPDALCSYMYNKIEQYPFYGFEKAGITLTTEDKIYFVDETNEGEGVRTGLAFEYACMPAECNVENELYGTRKDPLQSHISKKEWSEILEDGYTYVYLQSLDDTFYDDYADLFCTDEIETGRVYKVTNQNGNIELKLQ